jgi:23S rRNA (adenine2503-C2)-methyltransferase
MRDILSMTPERLETLFSPAYRAKQVFTWLHQKKAESFAEMTNLPQELRAGLERDYFIERPEVAAKQTAANGTTKFLFKLRDGNAVESVAMTYRHGVSLCVSTQAGCRMGCAFCASTLGGLKRNLTASEMLGQAYLAGPIGSIVLMGIGEPLDNYENVLDFLRIISHKDGQNLSLRHVSLSTCGLVDKIELLAKERLGLTLSVSLHAAEDELRSRLMPINNRWGVDELLAACRRYFEATGRRISFEYALIDGVNDTANHAKALAAKLKGFNCHVNLIPLNEVKERGFKKSGAEAIRAFQKILADAKITATVRRELGAGIEAACGQLRRVGAV